MGCGAIFFSAAKDGAGDAGEVCVFCEAKRIRAAAKGMPRRAGRR